MPRSLQEIYSNAVERSGAFELSIPHQVKQETAGLARKVQQMNAKPVSRIKSIYDLADKLANLIAPNVACKRGCNHCCHIRVPLNVVEASYISFKIEVSANIPKNTTLKPEKSYNYDTPCTFLKGGECSIYEHRPLACRRHANFDVDEETCRLLPADTVSVPNVPIPDFPFFKDAMDVVVALSGNPVVTDIRDYFPNGLDGK